MKYMKRFLVIILIALLSIPSFGCSNKSDTIKIATKPMTEQFILGEMIKLLIEDNTDLNVEITKGIGGGTSNIHPAIVKGDFDLYPEYTGTGWSFVLKEDGIPDDETLYKELQEKYKNNYDLSSFYEEFKDEIYVPKNSILGFSNSVIFDGSTNKPLELFEKKVNPNLKSDVKIELGSETIIINYKNEALQFTDLPQSSTFNNPYVYMGLQKALYRFIVNNSEDHECVDLDEIEPPNDGLDFKLYNLMKKKKISELNIENIDEVIYSISDKMLEKYTAAVRRLYSDGN